MSTKKLISDSKKDLKESESKKIIKEDNSGKDSSTKSNKSKDKEVKKKDIPNDTEEEIANLDSGKSESSKKDNSKKKMKNSNNLEKTSEEVSESENSSSKKTTKTTKKEDNENKDNTTKESDKESKSKKSERKSRNPTGYNIFMKKKMSELTGEDQKEKLKLIANLWKELNEEDKQKYNTEALEYKKVDDEMGNSERNKKKGKNISGYTLFMKDSINTIEAESQREKMVEVAKLWKEASKDVKDGYNEKAKAIKAEAQEEEVEIS